MMKPFKQAVQTRHLLDNQFGNQAEFVPSWDGSVAPERMDAFLAVRQKLMLTCDDFSAVDEQFDRLDEMGEDAPIGELLSELFGTTQVVFGMGTQMGKFFETRNQALLNVGMGRGEYTYLYGLAYLEQLRPTSKPEEEESRVSKHPNERVREALRQMLVIQLSVVEDQVSVSRNGRLPELEGLLREEIQKLKEDSLRIPWQDALPSWIAASFLPYRTQLDELFCESTLPFEFTQNRQHSFGIEGE